MIPFENIPPRLYILATLHNIPKSVLYLTFSKAVAELETRLVKNVLIYFRQKIGPGHFSVLGFYDSN